jgi:pimeloyl-ACP methyl ester carboxylesterase
MSRPCRTRWRISVGSLLLHGSLGLCGAGCLAPPPALPSEPPAAGQKPRAPVVAWPGKPPGELYAVGEIRRFDLYQGGQLIGRSWGRYTGPSQDGHHVFETRIELLPPGGEPVRSEGRLVLDAEGRLVEGFERSDAAELRFTRKGDAIEITDGQLTDEVTYDPDRRKTAVMAFGAVLHQELMFGMQRLSEEPMEWRLVALSGSAPLPWEGELLTLPGGPGDTYRIRTSLGEEVTLRRGRIVEIQAQGAGQKIVAAEERPEWPTFEIAGPRRLAYAMPADAAFTRRDVELPGKAGEPELAGEVLVPTRGKAPFPGVLFLSRMAGEDRYGFAGPPPVDLGSHEIHDALGNAGFCVLRFDERGTGKSARGEVSYAAQVEDARRALATLLVQPECDPDRVIVIGHGEGGLRALALGVEHGAAIDGVALLATPGRRYGEILRHQSEARLALAPPEIRKKAREEEERMLEELADGRTPPELAADAQWLREILAQDPVAMVAKLQARLLVAQGGKDFEVDPKVDAQALARAAKKARVVHELRRYPELDHLFKVEPEASSPSRYLAEDRRVAPAFLADLVAWAQSSVK